jgi:CubicO group peptidase (beta-lactamase class C family)
MSHSSDVQHAPIAELVPELDRLAVDAMADWKVPGAALVVVQDGKAALLKAYGQRDVEANLPVTAATLTQFGHLEIMAWPVADEQSPSD